jgi:hypothetical protein
VLLFVWQKRHILCSRAVVINQLSYHSQQSGSRLPPFSLANSLQYELRTVLKCLSGGMCQRGRCLQRPMLAIQQGGFQYSSFGYARPSAVCCNSAYLYSHLFLCVPLRSQQKSSCVYLVFIIRGPLLTRSYGVINCSPTRSQTKHE